MIRTFAQRADYNNHVEIRFIAEDGNGNQSEAKPIEFGARDEGDVFRAPALTMKRDDAQRLMDELWFVGLRPSEGSGSAGSLAATERHLRDMQKLAFHVLKVTP